MENIREGEAPIPTNILTPEDIEKLLQKGEEFSGKMMESMKSVYDISPEVMGMVFD